MSSSLPSDPPATGDKPLAWRGSFLARLPGGRHSYWMVIAAAAALTGLVIAVTASLAGGDDPGLGPLTPVVVATGSIVPGEALNADNTEVRSYPANTLPSGAVSDLSDRPVASAALYSGDVVTTVRLGGLPIGDRSAIAIPAHTAMPPLKPGDRVDVLVTLSTSDAAEYGISDAQATLKVATAAVVTDAADHAVTIAVTRDELPRTAFAVSRGSITLALVQQY